MSSQPAPYSGGFIENAPVVISFISADETDPEITTLIQLFKASFAHREVDGHNSLHFFCTCTIPADLLTVGGIQSAPGEMGVRIGLVGNGVERSWCAESTGLKAQHAVDETIRYAFPSLGWLGPVSSEERKPTSSNTDAMQRLAQACREAAAIDGDTPEATRDRRLVYARHGVPTRLNFTMMQGGGDLRTFPANGPNRENGRLLATCSEARILADYEGIEHPAFKFLTAFSTPRGGEPLASGEAGVAFDVIDLDRHGEVDGVAAFDSYLKTKSLSLEELLSTCLWSQTKSQGIHIFIKHLGSLSRSVTFEDDLRGVEIKSLGSFETLPNSFCRAWSPAEKRTVAEASYILKGTGDVVEGGPYYDAFRDLLQRPELHRDKPKNALPPNSATITSSEWERNALRNCLISIIDKQTDNAANAGEGGRNISLFSAVKTVAGHAANYEHDFPDVIGYDVAFNRFLSAAEQCGLQHDEAEATIKSGWRAGYNAPFAPIPIIERSPMIKSEPCRKEKSQKKSDADLFQRQSKEWWEPLSEDGLVLFDDEEMVGYTGVRWIVKGLIPRNGLGYLYGPSGTGKTFLALYLAKKIAYANEHPGEDVYAFGRKVFSGTHVFYLVYEGAEGIRGRSIALKQEYAWGQKNKKSFGLILNANKFKLFGDRFELGEDRAGEIEHFVERIPQGSMLIIDTLSQSSPGADKNSSRDMSEISNRALKLAKKMDGAVLLVAHTGKNVEMKLAGSKTQIDDADFALELKAHAIDGEKVVQIVAEKQKDARQDGGMFFYLKDVLLDGVYGQDGAQESSLVVVERMDISIDGLKPNTGYGTDNKKQTKEQERGQLLLEICREHTRSQNGVDFAPMKEVQEVFSQRTGNFFRQTFSRAIDAVSYALTKETIDGVGKVLVFNKEKQPQRKRPT